MSVEAPLPQTTITQSPMPLLARPHPPVRAWTVSDPTSVSSSSGQQLRSILLKNPPPRLEIRVSSADAQTTGDSQDNAAELDLALPPESLSTSTSNRTSSASCSSSDASAETSTSLLTPSSSNSSTCTSLTRTQTEPYLHSPSSSTTPSPSITFAPLPRIAPRKRNSSRPIGIAARGQILRQRREQMQQDVTTYYVTDQTNPDAVSRAIDSVNASTAASGDGCSGGGGGTYRIVVTPEQAEQMRMHAAMEAHARAKLQSMEARKAIEEDEGDGKEGKVVDDPIIALGRMLNDATKVLWRRVSTPKIKESSTPPSAASTVEAGSKKQGSSSRPEIGDGENRHGAPRRGKSWSSRLRSTSAPVASTPDSAVGSSSIKPKRRRALPDTSSDSDSVDELWKKEGAEDPMTRTIVSGSDDEDGFEHYVPAPEIETETEGENDEECFEDAHETEEECSLVHGEAVETGEADEEDNRSIADIALKDVEFIGQAC